MIKTAMKITAMAMPLLLCGIAAHFGFLHGGLAPIAWSIAIMITVSMVVFMAAVGSGPRLVVKGEGWPTWNFCARDHGPKVPAGSYEVRVIISPTTKRPIVVLDNPEDFGLNPTDLIGQDQEDLLRAIAERKVKMKLCV